ncbi:hypothetical protein, partial [Franconibacter helveticus]
MDTRMALTNPFSLSPLLRAVTAGSVLLLALVPAVNAAE